MIRKQPHQRVLESEGGKAKWLGVVKRYVEARWIKSTAAVDGVRAKVVGKSADAVGETPSSLPLQGTLVPAAGIEDAEHSGA